MLDFAMLNLWKSKNNIAKFLLLKLVNIYDCVDFKNGVMFSSIFKWISKSLGV